MKVLLTSFLAVLLACSCSTSKAVEKTPDLSPPPDLIKLLDSLQSPPKTDINPKLLTKKVTLELNEVTQDSVDSLIDNLHQLDKSSKVKEIWLKIDSPGGSVPDGNRLIDSMEQLHKKIVCVADHQAMSMGFFILQECPVRYMTKRTILMIHEPAINPGPEKTSSLENDVEFMKALTTSLLQTSSQKMKVSVPFLRRKIKNHDWYMDWKEAVKVKAVDKIVSPNSIPKVVNQ